MKRGTGLISAIVLFSFGLWLFWHTASDLPAEQQQAIAVWAMEEQLGSGLDLLTPTPSPTSSPSPSPQQVPVTVVEEAWDEITRETTYEPDAVPVTIPSAWNYALEIRNETDYQIDWAALPELPRTKSITVLIVHTHGSEGYADSAGNNYRTQDQTRSILAVGDVIAEELQNQGISVIHDKTLCDYPEYNGAYNRSRQVVQENLAQHPEIFLVLDVHRDAVADEYGNQMRMAASIAGTDMAQLMLVVGTNAGGLDHPDWQENLSLAAVVQSLIEENYPGLTRPLNLRTERFNQDLAPLSLLVEVGASGNTLEEAAEAGKCFAQMLGQVLRSCKET